MTEEKLLNDEELEKISGGNRYLDNPPTSADFIYPLGYHKEICDGFFFSHPLTHGCTLTKHGYQMVGNQYRLCDFFSGDSDVEGWYFEDHVCELAENDKYYNYDRPWRDWVVVVD